VPPAEQAKHPDTSVSGEPADLKAVPARFYLWTPIRSVHV